MIKKLLNSKFKKDLSFSYVTQAITVTFGFLQLFLINRYYGVEVFGQLAIIMSTAGIFSSLLTARSSEAVTRFFKREELNENFENAKFVLFIGFFIDLITALLLVLLIYLVSNFVAITFLKDIELQDEIIIYSFITFINFLRGSMTGYLQSKEMFYKMNIVTIIESFCKITFLMVAIFILNKHFLVNIIYVFLIASVVSFLYVAYIFIKSYAYEYKEVYFYFNKILFKEYWVFNLKTFTSSSLKIGATNIDNIILSYYSTTEIVGIYQTLKKLLSPLAFIVTPLTTLTLSKTVKLYEKKEFSDLHAMITRVTVILITISLIIVASLFLLLKPLLLFQNINYNDTNLVAFSLLSVLYILPIFIWWSRNFIIVHNPMIPIYSNILLSVNSIWIPLLLYKFDYFDNLTTICLGMLLAYMPSWLFSPIIYRKFMKKEKVFL
jgi:O-antigen/teichoic acid export membrane protein